MFRLLTRVQLAYVALFFLVSGGVVAYEATYIWPAERCEADGRWWSARYHECAEPIETWRITGRKPHAPAISVTSPAAAASNRP